MSGELKAKLEKWAVDLGNDTSKATEDFSDGNYVHYGALEMLNLLWPVIAAAGDLISHYAEEKKAVEDHRQRIVQLSPSKMLAIYDSLAKLEKELG